jgi:4-hydroxy-tetrahydrodipicolinate synthase
VVRLAALDNIIGIKDATGDLQRVGDFKARCPEDFAIYSGDDPTAMELMLAGGHGNISVTANIAPRQLAQLCQYALAGDREQASALNDRLSALNRALFLEANPIPVKWAMLQRGLIESGIRLPLTPLDERFHAQVLSALEAAAI